MVDPTHIVIDAVPKASNVALYLATGSLVVSLAAAITTYRISTWGHRSTWYHKVAVDPLLDAIFTFFEDQRATLTQAAIAFQTAKAANGAKGSRKTLPRAVTVSQSNFQDDQTKLYNQISARIEVFSVKGAKEMSNLLEDHQDSILGALMRGPDEVDDALVAAKTALINALRTADR